MKVKITIEIEVVKSDRSIRRKNGNLKLAYDYISSAAHSHCHLNEHLYRLPTIIQEGLLTEDDLKTIENI